MGYIYMLTFRSAKCYVGQTRVSITARFRQHRHEAKNSAKGLIYNAWRKHGPPIVTILGEHPDAELNEREQFMIAAIGSMTPYGYNVLPGGGQFELSIDGRERLLTGLRKRTDRWRENVRASLRARNADPEFQKRAKQGQIGQKRSAAARANMSAGQTGVKRKGRKPLTPEQKAHLSKCFKGKPLTAEHRAKVVAAQAKRRLTPEQRRGAKERQRAYMQGYNKQYAAANSERLRQYKREWAAINRPAKSGLTNPPK